MFEELWSLSFHHSHELIYFEFESIEVACVHVVILIVHEVFEDEVADVGVVGQFEDVFAEIVHALEVAVVRVIIGEGFENFDHFHS